MNPPDQNCLQQFGMRSCHYQDIHIGLMVTKEANISDLVYAVVIPINLDLKALKKQGNIKIYKVWAS